MITSLSAWDILKHKNVVNPCQGLTITVRPVIHPQTKSRACVNGQEKQGKEERQAPRNKHEKGIKGKRFNESTKERKHDKSKVGH
jgi:hypothetical protein